MILVFWNVMLCLWVLDSTTVETSKHATLRFDKLQGTSCLTLLYGVWLVSHSV